MMKRCATSSDSCSDKEGILSQRLQKVKRVNYAELSTTESPSSQSSSGSDVREDAQYYKFLETVRKEYSDEETTGQDGLQKAVCSENVQEEVNTETDFSDLDDHKPEADKSANYGHKNDTLTHSSDGEDLSDNRQRDYALGCVSETEVIFIDSDNESVDVKPRCMFNADVIKKESDCFPPNRSTKRDLKQNSPSKPEVIVIQPDSDLDSNPDVTTRYTNMMESQKPVTNKNDIVGGKGACVCKIVDYLLRKSKVSFKNSSSKTSSAEMFKTLMEKDSVAKEIFPCKEEVEVTEKEIHIDDNPPMDYEAGAGEENNSDVHSSQDKYKPTANPTETQEKHGTHNNGVEAGPSGIVEEVGSELSTESDTDELEGNTARHASPDRTANSPQQTDLVRRSLQGTWRQPSWREQHLTNQESENKGGNSLRNWCMLL